MSFPQAITVFCGASSGTKVIYGETAKDVGEAIAKEGWTLVYGGGTSGLMGTVSEACLDAGGNVHGVIPCAFLASRPAVATTSSTHTHSGSTTPSSRHPPVDSASPASKDPGAKHVQTIVKSMHKRKKLMADLSRGFIVLPGGYGSLEELAEMTTWTQLGIHKKPVILINVADFFSPLRTFIEGAIKAGFIQPSARSFLTFVDAPTASPIPSNAADPATSKEKGWSWGKEAIKAVKDWEEKGAGGGIPFSLEWRGNEEKETLGV